MRLLTYQSDDGLKLGIKTAQGVLDVAAAAAGGGRPSAPSRPTQCTGAERRAGARLRATGRSQRPMTRRSSSTMKAT